MVKLVLVNSVIAVDGNFLSSVFIFPRLGACLKWWWCRGWKVTLRERESVCVHAWVCVCGCVCFCVCVSPRQQHEAHHVQGQTHRENIKFNVKCKHLMKCKIYLSRLAAIEIDLALSECKQRIHLVFNSVLVLMNWNSIPEPLVICGATNSSQAQRGALTEYASECVSEWPEWQCCIVIILL
jgi:hypothetical protein